MALSPTELPILSRLLDEAMDLDAEAQAAWLAALPPEHAHLASTLKEMLAARAATASTGFLAKGARMVSTDDALPQPDERIGAYRLLREIGRGGMGSVWLAERADGAYKRQVALKLPRLAWGAGLAERMARERDIGALLEQPNIARLYDAGLDEHGRPFLAFEYVDGQPIDAWCEAQALDVQARLRLFVQVVRAVAYAHARLVVHRDLKPSNVLVSDDGQAHLLDFGIAKLLAEGTPGEADLTHDLGRVLTPQYASPEQIAGEVITVQSDVYSLGVLLYQLLTGALPHAAKRSTLGAVEEAILAGDVPLASSRAQDKTRARALRGEVDAIIAKAMQRDARRRYATADALAEDIERYLSGEAVSARPDSALYRLRKLLRRHRTAFAAATAVALSLIGGSAVALVQARHAGQAAARERIVKEFVIDVFRINDRGNPANAELRRLPAEMLLERGARSIEKKFAGQPDLQADLLGVVTEILLDMGAAKLAVEFGTKHVDAVAVLPADDEQRALALIRVGEALRDADRPGDALARAEAALKLLPDASPLRIRAGLLQAGTLVKQKRVTAALQALDRVDVEIARTPSAKSERAAQALQLRGSALSYAQRTQEATVVLRRAMAEADAANPSSRLGAQIRIDLAQMLIYDLDNATNDLHRFDERFAAEHRAAIAEPQQLFQQAVANLRFLGGADEVAASFAEVQSLIAFSDWGFMPFDEADAATLQVIRSMQALGPRVPPQTIARLQFRRGCAALNRGRYPQAYALMSGNLTLARSEDPDGFNDICLAMAATHTGHHEEAERIYARMRARIAIDPAIAFFNLYVMDALNQLMQGQFDGARRLLASSPFRPREGIKSEDLAIEIQSIQVISARLDFEQGRYDAVIAQLTSLEDRPYSLNTDRGLVLGAALCARGDRERGLALLNDRLAHYPPVVDTNDPDLAYWRSRAGQCALAAGDTARARERAQQARAAFQAQPGVAPFLKAPLSTLEQALGLRLPPV